MKIMMLKAPTLNDLLRHAVVTVRTGEAGVGLGEVGVGAGGAGDREPAAHGAVQPNGAGGGHRGGGGVPAGAVVAS